MFSSHNYSNNNTYDDNEGLVFSLVRTVANAFSCCTRNQKEEQATYNVNIKPSQVLLKEKGMFATSFDQIPCDGPIYDYQYRTGRRYVGGDNFPRTNDLDMYLARHKSLASIGSDGSLVLATEANLDFHILAEQFVDLFAEVSEAQVEEMRSLFPNEVAYFLEHGERLTSLVVKQEFTSKNGAENLEALQEIVQIIRGMNMGKFFSVLSQSSGLRCSSALSLPEEYLEESSRFAAAEQRREVQKRFPVLSPANAPSKLDSQKWLNDCSDGSDSGESLDPQLPQFEKVKMDMALDLTTLVDVESSLTGFSPLADASIELKQRSAVDVFEEWAAAQSPCVSPW